MENIVLPGYESRWQSAAYIIHRDGDGQLQARCSIRTEGETGWETEEFDDVTPEELLDAVAALLLDRW